ncbi:DUF488 domain-containing protein [Dictyobacter arantiisoli]|uniref:DUF488 domain-containing protein n=1 Tax=Dictyobacter arantiisoli TaxID=2014874 RepID=A0A5A5THL6_9CHLR|nr:DUF488 domain-containing protein [Dictyobacter arantiisoli]GCF11070.1 hypothetical protein KDI_46340 [Dictyobacter arantiisoli]
MFYRRKILLALIEIFGGSLAQEDCKALLFLFCLRREKNFYDFFPSNNSVYSVILQSDKRRLTTLGFLADLPDFQIHESQVYTNQLQKKDQSELLAFQSEIGDIRNKALLQLLYRNIPSFVSGNQRPSPESIPSHNNEEVCSCLLTLGYEGLTIDGYLDILLSHQVKAIIDVRKNPISMKQGFSKKQFAAAAQMAGLTYIHIPDLGIPALLRKNLTNDDAYKNLFAYYAAEILPEHHDALEHVKALSRDFERVALTCFEANPMCCHRHKIVEQLQGDPNFKVPVQHLNAQSTSLLSTQSLQGTQSSHGFLAKNAVYSLV